MSIAVVGSPPYAESIHAGNGIDQTKLSGNKPGPHTQAGAEGYGRSVGQLGALPPGTVEETPAPTHPVPVTIWQGCYSDGWQDLIVPEAFAHPAKFARGLIHRIYRHLIERGYVQAGATVLDPFGGVGLGALDALTYGLRYIGVELEPRFVTLAQQNLALWRQRYGFSGGTVVQGDSRRLREVLAGVAVGAVVGSPPYCDQLQQGEARDPLRMLAREQRYLAQHPELEGKRPPQHLYGHTPGQLGAMPPGQVGCVVGSPPFQDQYPSNADAQWHQARASIGADNSLGRMQSYGTTPGQLGAMPPGAVVSSPPYAGAGEVLGTHNGIDWSKAQDGGKVATPARQASGEGYGTSAGQLGAMPVGPLACVSSPPWEGVLNNHDSQANMQELKDAMRRDGKSNGGKVGASMGQSYGTSPEQLGNTAGDTFWAASAQIMAELAALLPPGAVCAWVLKAYVSKKAIVPFPQQWQALCEAHGFVLIEEIHASMVEHHGTQEGLFEGPQQVTTEKKSFFRRLAEKKGSPRIDYETVLILRKAGDTGGMCVVGSPPYEASVNGDSRPYGGIASPEQQGGVFHGTYGTTPGNLGTMPVEKTP